MNPKAAIIAKRYAQAFINTFLDKLDLKSYQNMQRAAISINKQVLFFLRLPVIDYKVKKDALALLGKRFNFSFPEQKLLTLLLNDNRAFLICEVLHAVCALYRQYKNIAEFTMISSHALKEDEKEIIKDFLAQATGQDIMYTEKVDKKLIAGIRLQSDFFLWEYSIAQRIDQAKLLLCPVRGI